MSRDNSYTRRAAICGTAALLSSVALSPKMAFADVQSGAAGDAGEQSWRFINGSPVEQAEELGGTMLLSAVSPWGKDDEGRWCNSYGDPIPGALLRGIDVSEHQGKIDWNAVNNSDVDYAIVRAYVHGTVKKRPDYRWDYNASECERLGIPYGAYIYSLARTPLDAVQEAEDILSALKGKRPTYPIYIDLEDNLIADADVNAVAAAFCERIESAGYQAGVYANLNWWTTKLTSGQLSGWSRWVAQYNYQCDYSGHKDMWQSTSKGSIAGISGNVDINFDYVGLSSSYADQTVWVRLYGQNHLDTMRAISMAGWKSVDTVVVATNASYHDSLAASALAGACGSPIIITNASSLPPQAEGEIKRLSPRSAIVVGGSSSVSDGVVTQIKVLGCSTVERIWGQDAPGTARAVAKKMREFGKTRRTCIVATSATFHDALSISPFAYWSGSPILLCDSDNCLSAESLNIIREGGYSEIIIVGGRMSVAQSVESDLRSIPGVTHVKRLSGQSAYETSLAIAQWELQQGMTVKNVGIANGLEHYDALAGGALCGQGGSPLLVVSNQNRVCITDFVAKHKGEVSKGYVFGGPNSVSQQTWLTLLRNYLF